MKRKKLICILAAVMIVTALCCTTAFAAGDVASAVESTWKGVRTQGRRHADQDRSGESGLPGAGYDPRHCFLH